MAGQTADPRADRMGHQMVVLLVALLVEKKAAWLAP